jgi:hypothetical protein
MAEWLIAPVLKTGIVRNKELSRVRIPLSPFAHRMDLFILLVLVGSVYFLKGNGSAKWWYSRARKKKKD